MALSLSRRGWMLAGVALSAMFVVGCVDEPVRVYEVPREKQRLLAAIIPLEQETWFFKLMGQYDDTTQNAEDFWKFVRSVRFPKEGAEPIAWSAPQNWTFEPGADLRYATFRIPRDQEVTVFKFGPQPKMVIENINRWRKQLKLPPMDAADFGKIKNEPIDGNPALLIDLESARTEAIDIESLENRVKSRNSDEQSVPQYKVPEGWKEISRTGRMFVAGFRVGEGELSAEITLTPFPGRAGGVAANINRWRGEVGLAELPEAEAVKEAQSIDVDGVKSAYVDCSGTNPRTSKKARTLGVISTRDETAWFIKMMGDPELVAKQKPVFESFVRSIRFGGGN